MAGFTFVVSSGGVLRSRGGVDKAPFVLHRLGASAGTPLTENAGNDPREGIVYVRDRTLADNNQENADRPFVSIIEDSEFDPLKFMLTELGAMYWAVAVGNNIHLVPITTLNGANRALKLGGSASGVHDTQATVGLDLMDVPEIRMGRKIQFLTRDENTGNFLNEDRGSMLWECQTEEFSVASGPITQTANVRFPVGVLKLACAVRVNVQPGGTSTMSVGYSGDSTIYANAMSTAAGSLTSGFPLVGSQGVNREATERRIELEFDVGPTDNLGRIRLTTFFWGMNVTG